MAIFAGNDNGKYSAHREGTWHTLLDRDSYQRMPQAYRKTWSKSRKPPMFMEACHLLTQMLDFYSELIIRQKLAIRLRLAQLVDQQFIASTGDSGFSTFRSTQNPRQIFARNSATLPYACPTAEYRSPGTLACPPACAPE